VGILRGGDGERRITGRHVLYMLLGFFGVMLAANAVFIWLALDTFTGAVSERPYEEGLAYNQRLEAAAAQRAQHWRGEIEVEGRTLALRLADAAGRPLGGFQLEVLFQRPTHQGMDRRIPMTETAPGLYKAPLSLPASGNWDSVVTGRSPDGADFETRKRIWVE